MNSARDRLGEVEGRVSISLDPIVVFAIKVRTEPFLLSACVVGWRKGNVWAEEDRQGAPPC